MLRALRAEATRALAMAAAVGLAAAARAEDPRAASGGPLRIAVDPPRLVAGQGGALVRIGAPADVTDLELSANTGRFEDVRPAPGGGFTARYVPSSERWPRVAIVTALARGRDGPVDGWIAVPISGRGEAKVHTRPGAEVTLQVGERTFGPARADRNGIAAIPITVPPGVREAHHGFHPIDLRIPESSLLHAVIERRPVRADLGQSLRVFAYVVAPHGAARRGDVPVFEPTRGEVQAQAREPGAFAATWRLPPGPVGVERLAVRLPGAAASRTVLTAEVVAGPPATVAIAFDRDALVAGDAEPLAVTARVLDAAGNATRAAVELEADGGELRDVAERSPGVFEARVRVPPRFGGRTQAVVTARVPAAGISGSRVLPLVAAAPATARLEADRRVLLADGARPAAFRLSVVDRYENPVPRLAPAVSAGRGRVLAVSADEPGVYVVRYLPPAVDTRTDERLDVDLGGVRARADVVLVPPERGIGLSPYAGVARELHGRFVARQAGLSAELPLESRLGPMMLGVRVDAGGLGFAWSGSAAAGHVATPPATVDAGVATVLVGAIARSEPWPRLELWSSATLGAALARTQASGAPAALASGPAARVAAGAGWRVPFGVPFLEVGMLAAGRTTSDLRALAAVTASVGVRFEMPAARRAADASPGAERRMAGDRGDGRSSSYSRSEADAHHLDRG